MATVDKQRKVEYNQGSRSVNNNHSSCCDSSDWFCFDVLKGVCMKEMISGFVGRALYFVLGFMTAVLVFVK